MSAEHKAALAQGRAEGQAVRAYLDALRNNKPKRGRRRTPASIQARLTAIEEQLPTSDTVTHLHLIQERRNLHAEISAFDQGVDLDELEEAFVEIAQSYSERQHITYAAWREIGIHPTVLARAGVPRSRS